MDGCAVCKVIAEGQRRMTVKYRRSLGPPQTILAFYDWLRKDLRLQTSVPRSSSGLENA